MKLLNSARLLLSQLIFVGLVFGLQGCGGGGGGTPNAAPTASSVAITDVNGGSVAVGDSLTGSYTYADTNSDAEGTTTFRWLRAGTAITGATSVNYTLAIADGTQSITFEVTPVAATGTLTGSAVTSTAVTPPINTSLVSTARGYYEGAVTLNVVAGDLMINDPDLKAIVDEKEFVVVYKGSQILFYKGTFTEVSATTFKANIRVYQAGNFIATAEITNGTINAGVLNGTIVGTGAFVNADYASSAVDMQLTYNNANALAPPAYITAKSWQDAAPVTGAVQFNSSTNISFIIAINNVPTELSCNALDFDTTNVVTEQTGRIRKFLTSALTSCSTNTSNGKQLNGYFTNYNGGGTQDDRMLLVVSDDNFAYVGILPCLDGTGFCF